MKHIDYPYNIRTLTEEEGGGFYIEFPDLPGCCSDGETIEEVIANGNDAVETWIEIAIEDKEEVPEPWSVVNSSNYTGRLSQRLPKSMHRDLALKAKEEGVSINTLVLSYLAKCLGNDYT